MLQSSHSFLTLFSSIVLIALFGLFAVVATPVAAQVPDVPATVTVELEKKFSGAVPQGYTAQQFSFSVVGNGVDEIVTLSGGSNSAAQGTIDLPIGAYTITEIGPDGFVPGEWRPGWYGQCDASTDFSTTLQVTEGNVDHGTLYCQVDNQWRYGTLTVKKEFVGTTTAFSNFSFAVTQDGLVKHDGAFSDSGETVVVIGEGAYTVAEADYPSYTPSYSGDCDADGNGSMGFEDNQTCVITNTYDDSYVPPVLGCTDPQANNFNQAANTDDGSCTYSNGGDGNGDGDEPKYLVFGYVWHDANANTNWEGFGDDQSTSTEDELPSWTVTITSGSTTLSTTTDETGYYYFYVPAGTWIVTEILQAGWSQTFPLNNQHLVEVVDETLVQAADDTLLARLYAWVLPVVYAQSPTVYGPFNFGNVFTGTGGGNGSGPTSGSNPSGGGSGAPFCQSFTATLSGSVVTLAWDTTRGTNVKIERAGVELFYSTDDDITDEGTFETPYVADAVYELTVARGGRADTCTAAVNFAGGQGGGTPQVLGDQVAAVPLGAASAGAGGATPVSVPQPQPASAILLAPLARRHG